MKHTSSNWTLCFLVVTGAFSIFPPYVSAMVIQYFSIHARGRESAMCGLKHAM